MAPLTSVLGLLTAAVSYAGAAAGLATPELLAQPTPCAGWDLAALLRHLGDSIGVLTEAMTEGSVGPDSQDSPVAADPVRTLRDRASVLLAACTSAGPADCRIVIGERELAVSMLALTGALELTVHGWDVAVACDSHAPIPPDLAAVMLPVAPLLVTPAVRPGLFADPVRLSGPAGPGDQLVAFLGRDPAG